MSKLPTPFWAIILAAYGFVITICVLFHPEPINIGLAVLTVASNLVSGALGAFAGAAGAHPQANQPDTKITGANPTINQSPVLPQPGEPDQQ